MAWQNNLVRVAFLITIIGTLIVVVFIFYVSLNADHGNPGAVATPVLLGCLVGVLILLVGIALERENVKRRLPKVRRKQIVIGFLSVALFFGLKSFFFGLGIGILLIFSVFLLREFKSRLRGVAVCAALVCLVIAEAMRRSGGYDSGGIARYVLNVYAFSAFFFPGLLWTATIKKLPTITSFTCLGFGILTLHSGAMLCAGMSSLLDDSFAGKSLGGGEHDHCIKSTISSPIGLVVETFQTMINPDYEHTTTMRTTQTTTYFSTTITTTFDCGQYQFYEDKDGENSTNVTNSSMMDIRLLEGVDLSHCTPVELVVNIDPNSTTTTSTSTTSTSTTSTTSTSTTTTSTTSTTTTTTTTSTTSTTTSTTTTTTSSSSTTEINMTTTEFVTSTSSVLKRNDTLKAYEMTPNGEYCESGKDITEEDVCRAAATVLGLTYGNAWNGAGEHKNCFFADDNRYKVFFNGAVMPSPNPTSDYASMCYRVAPFVAIVRCAPGSDEMEITWAGTWAMAVFFLWGVWANALCLVIVIFAPAKKVDRVHPTHEDRVDHTAADPYGLDAFNKQRSVESSQEELSRFKKMKKCCKKCCKFIFHSIETIVGLAFFVASGITLVVVAGLKLPMDKPYCADEPVDSLLGWSEEPPRRVAVVWCENGAMASVLLSFLAFCYFLLAFTMTLLVVQKFRLEERKRQYKRKLLEMRVKSISKGEAVEDQADYGIGFRVQKMAPKEGAPDAIFSDYDGRIFDV